MANGRSARWAQAVPPDVQSRARRERFLATGFGDPGRLLILHVDVVMGLGLGLEEERGCDG